jgi:cytochrome c oxidase cbb3-type subunit 3
MPLLLSGQEVAEKTTENNVINIDINWLLTGLAIILLIPVFLTGKNLLIAINENALRNLSGTDNIKKTGLLIFFVGLSQIGESKSITSVNIEGNWITGVLIGVITLEVFLIIFLAMRTSFYFKPLPSYLIESSENSKGTRQWINDLWNKINKFKPISEEASIDSGHNYDGIRELDNVTPPWFITGFILTIIFAAVYLYRYHIGNSAPLQIEEFEIEMAQAEKDKAAYLATQANKVDESSVKMLGDADIDAGHALFTQSCVACHGQTGGSMPGGVGPNLTDEYWLHGGSITDIFKTIKYGWPEKGMISWQNTFSPMQMAQIASYIKSLGGTNPPNAKSPQGELYKDDLSSSEKESKDSTITKSQIN